jgi:hypothetical protein
MRIRATACCLLILLATACSTAGTATDPVLHAQREDIAAFRTRFLEVDRAFSVQARARAEQRLARMEQARTPSPPVAFAVELCRIAALADNGHTLCLPNPVGRDMCAGVAAMGVDDPRWCQPTGPAPATPEPASVPIALYPFDDDMYVTGADEHLAELLGARLVAVEDRSVDTMRPVLHTFSGGTRAHRDEKAADVLTKPAWLHAVGLAEQPDAARYRFVLGNGRQVERVLSLREERGAWLPSSTPSTAAWAFQEPGVPFRYRDVPEIDSIVVQLRRNSDDGQQRIADFLASAESRRASLGRRNVVLDMRFNGGGNFLLTRDFMIRWPDRVPGHFYVLTSRRTFSAAITGIAYLKQAAPDRVIVVGESAGDRLEFFSDGLPVSLPHSGLYFLPAVVRMDYRDGCRRHDDCAAAVAQRGRPVALWAIPYRVEPARIPIAIATLQPDIPVIWTINSWMAGEDPMMEAVRQAVLHPAR